MPGKKSETSKNFEASLNPQDIASWLKRPLTFTAPTWVFAVAGLVALALLGIALD